MTVARIFTPENRLAKILQALDAPLASELIASANERVAKLSDAIRAYVDEKVQEILTYATRGEEVMFAECNTLGMAALNVAEVAGAAGQEAVGEVARGIGAMVDGLVSEGVWHSDALKLHLDALILVNQPGGGSAEENKLILAQLRCMREAIGVKE